MSTQSEGIETPEEAPARGETTYVVQVQRTMKGLELSEDVPEVVEHVWIDVATVALKPKAPRKGVIAKALKQAGIKPKEPVKVRVLDTKSAEVFEPEPFQPESEWRIK
jgi:hypothetical protein